MIFHYSKASEIIERQDPSVKNLEKLDYLVLNNLQELQKTHFKDVKYHFYQKYIEAKEVFTQFDMAMVQSAFFASLVVFPKIWGVESVPR